MGRTRVVNSIDRVRRAAGYVDRVLKGARPAELPVQRPSAFELVVKLKTEKALAPRSRRRTRVRRRPDRDGGMANTTRARAGWKG